MRELQRCPGCRRGIEVQTLALARTIAATLTLMMVVVAHEFGGSLLRQFLEGMQRTTLPYWKGLVAAGAVVLAWAAWIGRWQRRACPTCAPVAFPWRTVARRPVGRGPLGIGRRDVFSRALLAASGFASAALAAVFANRDWAAVFGRVILAPAPTLTRPFDAQWRDARVRSWRRLGRTGLRVSDISFGCGQLQDADVARRAIDRGINYFDTSPDYAHFGSEHALGQAMRGRRDQVVVATKFCSAHGHLPNETPVVEIIRSVEGSLRRLATDYVDLIHIHSCDRLDRLLAPNIHEAFDRLREQGKVRFLGVSSHAPNLESVASAAIDSGRFDVLMLAYHFGMWPSLAPILDRATGADVGIVAMKTLKGARPLRLERLPADTNSYPQAAFRWVLSNASVSCLVVSIVSEEQIFEYLHASGEAPRSADRAVLERYDALVAGDYCQPHCGVCRTACPAQLPIDDILRARMYHRDYGWAQEARRVLAPLARLAEACRDCSAPCAPLCPQHIDIRGKVLDTIGTSPAQGNVAL